MHQYTPAPLKNRTWLTLPTLKQIAPIHADAFLILHNNAIHLVIYWTRNGRKRIALDGWLVTPSLLIPIWDVSTVTGQPLFWSRHNHALIARVHANTLKVVDSARAHLGAVSLLCHYVPQSDPEPLTVPNRYGTTTKRRI